MINAPYAIFSAMPGRFCLAGEPVTGFWRFSMLKWEQQILKEWAHD